MAALITPMLVFTFVIGVLAAAVLSVRTRLTRREQVAITLNQRRVLGVVSGDTLLDTLQQQGIELPAACGGRGACGQCRVQVESDQGSLLPTELNHISRQDASKGVRLACMLKVRDDMSVRLPAGVLEAQRCVCSVRANDSVSTYLKTLVLELPPGVRFDFEAGDYIMLEAPPSHIAFSGFEIDPAHREDWQREGLLGLSVTIPVPTSRAYSLGNSPAEQGVLMLVVRIATPPAGAEGAPPGLVSSYVFSLRPGDEVTVAGPFGEFHVRDSDREMILVGGGAGIAPLRSIILDQLTNRTTRRRISFWYGSRNLRDLCFFEEFEALAARYENFDYHVALSDPDVDSTWPGDRGLIHRVLYERYLHDHPCPEEAEYYLCGPPLMSSATLAMLEDLGVDRDSVLFDDFGGSGEAKR